MSAPTIPPPAQVQVSRRALLRGEAKLQAITAGVLWLLVLLLAGVGEQSGARLVADAAGALTFPAAATTVVCVVWLCRAALARP